MARIAVQIIFAAAEGMACWALFEMFQREDAFPLKMALAFSFGAAAADCGAHILRIFHIILGKD